ncbi:5-formyltetrahydrofolate cyclo-ligase [Carnobacterium viridans]|uniref:5-formyltetrahydrofolate cyclo-ligase n=1 Tax=Carnobacterium viridans TaxID=174587 RepID=A0A1H0Z3J4_9LACT|nr:5-formyltetrahydrofolate cyclo-ligase [Carnobacterium viridans]UDE94809.1 5-formyltetrahydrofolate cyclo-ligase [Carnobacterium viridans]SDQ22035.1 5-formyltetrahydrofolate cyclo-ligase [Carnobacterium viridans]
MTEKIEKQALRKKMISLLNSISAEEKAEIELKLEENLFRSSEWKSAKRIGVTLSQGFEWNTLGIINKAWKEGKIVCAPKCVPEHKAMIFYDFTSTEQLEKGFHNLIEPKPAQTKRVEKAEIDLVLVPGLIFDEKGYRVGFGGGYYDRFLKDFPNHTIGLICSEQVTSALPIEPFDIPVQKTITEKSSL